MHIFHGNLQNIIADSPLMSKLNHFEPILEQTSEQCRKMPVLRHILAKIEVIVEKSV
jgi:hypothetical protein